MRCANKFAMPGTKELVGHTMSVVAEVTEIPCGTILSRCSRAEVVDARWMAVYLLHKSGVYTMAIAEHMGISPRYVQYIITDFADRISVGRQLRTKYEQAANKLRNNLEITAL